MRAEFLAEAESELSEAADRYDEANPGVGNDFAREVRRAIELILDNNRIGKSVSTGAPVIGAPESKTREQSTILRSRPERGQGRAVA